MKTDLLDAGEDAPGRAYHQPRVRPVRSVWERLRHEGAARVARQTRAAECCAGLECLGIRVDPVRNAASAEMISGDDGACMVLVVRTDEELMIARHAAAAALMPGRRATSVAGWSGRQRAPRRQGSRRRGRRRTRSPHWFLRTVRQ